MITIIDYGIGNIQAFVNVYKRLHIPVQVARVNSDLKNVEKLVLPGVGSFDHAMLRFTESGMREAVEFLVKDKGIPVLGICVGMQMLADRSDEGKLPGLGWIPGHVRSFRSVTGLQNIAMPHMGWNDVVSVGNNPLFNGLEQGRASIFCILFTLKACISNMPLRELSTGMTSIVQSQGTIFSVSSFIPRKATTLGSSS